VRCSTLFLPSTHFLPYLFRSLFLLSFPPLPSPAAPPPIFSSFFPLLQPYFSIRPAQSLLPSLLLPFHPTPPYTAIPPPLLLSFIFIPPSLIFLSATRTLNPTTPPPHLTPHLPFPCRSRQPLLPPSPSHDNLLFLPLFNQPIPFPLYSTRNPPFSSLSTVITPPRFSPHLPLSPPFPSPSINPSLSSPSHPPFTSPAFLPPNLSFPLSLPPP